MPAKPRRRTLKPRKSPKQERGHATVDAILQASAYILAKQGYAALTTNRIAEKAGVNIASIYQYFPNKEAIFVELLRRHAEAQRRRAQSLLVADESFEGRITSVIAATVAAHAVEPELHRVLTETALRLELPRFETDADEALAMEARRWTKTWKRENAALALWMAQSAVHALVHTAFCERPEIAKSPVFTKELTKLVLRFLGA